MEEEIIFRVEVPGAEKAITSIENLTKANKELREERKKLDLESEQGQARARQINAQLDANTEKIKNNSSALEKQRFKIGDYTGALDKLVPGLGATANGFGSMTKQALAFIATPIGAILAAIGLTVSALVTYFKKFEVVLDVIEDVVTKLTAVFSSFIQNLDKVASIVGNVLIGNFSKASDQTKNLANELSNAADEAQRLLDLTRELEDAELKYRIETAAAANQMKALVVASKNRSLSIEESNKLLQQASDLENELTAKAVKLAQQRADIEEGKLVASKKAQLQAANLLRQTGEAQAAYINRLIESGIFSPEQLDPLISAYERVEQEASAGFAFQEKIANQQAALFDKQQEEAQKRVDKQRELNKAYEEIQLELIAKEAELYQLRIEDFKEFLEGKKAIEDEVIRIEEDEEADREDKAAQQDNIRVANEIKRDKLAGEQRLKTSQILFGGLEQSLRAFGLKSKVISSGLALANTFLGVTEILKAPTAPFIEPFASIVRGIQIATTIATGLGAVKQINSAQFARGGILDMFTKIFHDGGVLNGPSHAHGGIPFAVGGRVGFEAEGGEAIINRRSTAMYRHQLSAINQAGGGVPFAVGGITNEVARSSESATSQREIFNAIAQIKPVVTVEDINIGQNRVEVIEQRAQVI